MKYIAGWNLPGCLPDTAEPLPRFDTWNLARDFLLDEFHRLEIEESDSDVRAVAATAADKLDVAPHGEDWVYPVGVCNYWIECVRT